MTQLRYQTMTPITANRFTSGHPPLLDRQICSRIRRRRLLLGMSRPSLAHALGVSEDVVEGYELGSIWIEARRLWQIADVLGVAIRFFYAEPPGPEVSSRSDAIRPGPGPGRLGARSTAMASHDGGCLDYTPDFVLATDFIQALEIIRAYCRPADSRVRQTIIETMKDILSAGAEPPAG